MRLLFTEKNIGSVKLKNRMIMSPLHLGFSENGEVNQREIDFYRERAAGGIAAIIFGGVAVAPAGALPGMPVIRKDSDITMLRKLFGEIKKHDCRVFVQLFHAGKNAYSETIGTQAIGPSAMKSALTGEEVREMSEAELAETIQNFADTAEKIKEAGGDGVEISASVGYLLSEFFSPRLNKRSDEYGGSPENRMRFPQEVVRAVRERVGADFAVTIRISGSEMIEGGADLRFMQDFCASLNDVLDAVHVTGGWHEAPVPQITAHVPPGGYAFLAGAIKSVVTIPVIAANRINDGEIAEEILRRGLADFVGLGRGMIADPQLPNKIRNKGNIRRCVACNQGCIEEIFKKKAVRCLVNARIGLEGEYPDVLAEKKKKILVIGDGPAGLEAARSAAERGHRVKIYGKGLAPGGQLRVAFVPPDKQELRRLLDYLLCELDGLGVEIEQKEKIELEELRREKPDKIIVATGAKPLVPPIPGLENVKYYRAWDILDPLQDIRLHGKTVIIGGGSVGLETALYLADKKMEHAQGFLGQYAGNMAELLEENNKITVVEMLAKAGKDVGGSNRWILLNNLKAAGVEVKTNAPVKEVKGNRIIVEEKGEAKEIEFANLILAVGAVSEGSELIEALEKEGFEYTVIGDALKPRKILEAIYEGFIAGYN